MINRIKKYLPGKSRNSEGNRSKIIRNSIWALLLVNFSIIVLLVIDILDPFMSSRTLDTVGTLLSAFLTFVLIFVYMDISFTQNDLLDIQDSQENLMRHEKTSKLIPESLEYSGDDSFEVVLSNLGGGFADPIRIRIVPEFHQWDTTERELSQTSSGLLEYQEPLSRKQAKSDQPSLITKDNYLDGNEKSVAFEFNLGFECDTDGDGFFSDFDKKDNISISFHKLIEYSVANMEYTSLDTYMQSCWDGSGLSDTEISELAENLPFNRVRMTFLLVYPGIEENQSIEREIADRMIPFEPDLDMEDIWKYSEEFDSYIDQLEKTKSHMNGFDPIGAAISQDQFREEQN